MSNLLRSVVKKSLQDLIDFMLQYQDGNDYPEEYHIFRGLAVSQLKQPSTLILVCLIVLRFILRHTILEKLLL